MILNHTELVRLVEDGVILGVSPEQINAASIDLTLSNALLLEPRPNPPGGIYPVIDLAARPRMYPDYIPYDMDDHGGYYDAFPGEFFLAASQQVFNLPNDLCFVYRLNSSAARAGINHALAGFADPGWHGSQLTLELSNQTRYHTLRLSTGMKLGQIIISRIAEVSDDASYSTKGSYNNSTGPTVR